MYGGLIKIHTDLPGNYEEMELPAFMPSNGETDVYFFSYALCKTLQRETRVCPLCTGKTNQLEIPIYPTRLSGGKA